MGVVVTRISDELVITRYNNGSIKITGRFEDEQVRITADDVQKFREAVAPIDEAMVDRALLAHLNESRKQYGLPTWDSLEQAEESVNSKFAKELWGHERAKMKTALEAAYSAD